jgi:nucleoside-diphosphate-sugar epimerase
MNILLTGGCGYVGTPLTESLLEAGHTVTVVDLQWFGNFLPKHPRLTVICEDIRNADRIPMAGVDVVMHLANIANDPCSDLNSKLNWEVNALATMLLVERAISHRVPQFIFASSGSVYGVKDEAEVTEDLSLVPISDYNKTKMVSERILLSYADRILVNILRPATICGYSPRMRLDLSVNMLTMQALVNHRITVFGGDQTRPNIHLQDMIRVYHHFSEARSAIPRGVQRGVREHFDSRHRAARHPACARGCGGHSLQRSPLLSSLLEEAACDRICAATLGRRWYPGSHRGPARRPAQGRRALLQHQDNEEARQPGLIS